MQPAESALSLLPSTQMHPSLLLWDAVYELCTGLPSLWIDGGEEMPLGSSLLQVQASAASSCLAQELSSSAWRQTRWCGCILRGPYWTNGQTRRRQPAWLLQHRSQMMLPLKPLQAPISMRGFSQVEDQPQDQGGSNMGCSSFGIVCSYALPLCLQHQVFACLLLATAAPSCISAPASAHLLGLLARTATVQALSICP